MFLYVLFLRHEALSTEQTEIAYVQKLLIKDKIDIEKSRQNLIKLRVANQCVKMIGSAVVEAKRLAESDSIDGEATVDLAKRQTEATKIEFVRIFL